jgi:hypothetical protein
VVVLLGSIADAFRLEQFLVLCGLVSAVDEGIV